MYCFKFADSNQKYRTELQKLFRLSYLANNKNFEIAVGWKIGGGGEVSGKNQMR